MYYEEKMIDGIIHYRGTPDGEWTPYTLKELSSRYVNLMLNNEQLRVEIADARG